jgi:DNA-binding FadR family transcriptional regulator
VAIYNAVEAQDARTARAAMERHMGAATARLRATLMEEEGDATATDAGLS